MGIPERWLNTARLRSGGQICMLACYLGLGACKVKKGTKVLLVTELSQRASSKKKCNCYYYLHDFSTYFLLHVFLACLLQLI